MMEDLSRLYENCTLCPRNCRIDRRTNKGFCKEGSAVRASRAGLHSFEEPFLSGENGSGTVFFTGCSLRCIFCQNSSISLNNEGFDTDAASLAKTFLNVQAAGAHNINLVTGTHFTPTIAMALKAAKENGLTIPVVWNSSAYEKPETLSLLEGLVDIWMPDLKSLSADFCARYFHAPDYPQAAKESIEYMGSLFDTSVIEDGLMKKGMIVRHLQMPGQLNDTKAVLDYLYGTFGDRIWISLMNQYTPFGVDDYPEINKTLSKRSYEKAVDYAINIGITNCLIQEGATARESFIPHFDGEGIITERITRNDQN